LRKALGNLQLALTPPEGDGQLLARFLASHDEAAFAALVRRHGSMVYGVCRRLLGNHHDAEDALQATFLVLARKAQSVLKHEAVGSWLYAVAYRTAQKLRSIQRRRQAREKPVLQMPQPAVEPVEVQDWRPLLDAELSRLPEVYRAPVLLCDLEGQSHREAARQLGLGNGTLARRLAAGRGLLAARLSRRGVTLSGGALAALLSQTDALAKPAASLVVATARAAGQVAVGHLPAVAAPVALLTKGVLRAMWLTKLKVTLGAVLLVAALGAGGLAYRAESVAAAQEEKPGEGKPRSELEALRRENELLKLNLEVVLEKVRAQETELRALRAKVAGVALDPQLRSAVVTGPALDPQIVNRVRTVINLPAPDRPEVVAGQQAEAALKALREAKDNAVRQRAMDALERALQGLREQLRKTQPDRPANRR
jgi:RNA polymerase sigma factor (sigma-70 family)